MRTTELPQIGMTAEALEHEIAKANRARRRREQELRRSSATTPHSRAHSAKHNRAAAKAAWKREVRI